MKMHLETSERNLIANYGVDGISVNRERYQGVVLVGATTVISDLVLPPVREMQVSDFEPALALDPEIIVLGTGSRHQFPHPQLMAELAGKGCALEVMSTDAACRTFNVLVSEMRDVVGVLLPISVIDPGSQIE